MLHCSMSERIWLEVGKRQKNDWILIQTDCEGFHQLFGETS